MEPTQLLYQPGLLNIGIFALYVIQRTDLRQQNYRSVCCKPAGFCIARARIEPAPSVACLVTQLTDPRSFPLF